MLLLSRAPSRQSSVKNFRRIVACNIVRFFMDIRKQPPIKVLNDTTYDILYSPMFACYPRQTKKQCA